MGTEVDTALRWHHLCSPSRTIGGTPPPYFSQPSDTSLHASTLTPTLRAALPGNMLPAYRPAKGSALIMYHPEGMNGHKWTMRWVAAARSH